MSELIQIKSTLFPQWWICLDFTVFLWYSLSIDICTPHCSIADNYFPVPYRARFWFPTNSISADGSAEEPESWHENRAIDRKWVWKQEAPVLQEKLCSRSTQSSILMRSYNSKHQGHMFGCYEHLLDLLIDSFSAHIHSLCQSSRYAKLQIPQKLLLF